MEKFLIRSNTQNNNCLLKKDQTFTQLMSCNHDFKSKSVADSLSVQNSAAEKKEKEILGKKKCNSYDTFVNKRKCPNDETLSDFSLNIIPHSFRSITAENLNLKYSRILSKATADYIFQKLEEEIEYFSGDLSKVRVYGKWHNIPRKQVSFGDPGLFYAFSGNCVPAVPWSKCNIIKELKNIVESVSKHSFNFVLVNRYKDGLDHMGEHRDDEKDLVPNAPIASLSFGQARDFIFKHKDARGSKAVRKINPVKLELEHGSLLLMEFPTNKFWFHSLPVRKKASDVRINLTFRDMVTKK